MKLFFFITACIFCLHISAQVNIDSMRLQYNQKTMLPGFNRVIMNGMLLGKTGTKNLMLLSPEATMHYKLYQKNTRSSFLINIIGAGAVISGFFITKEHFKTGRIITISGSAINILGMLFAKKANSHLQQAIWSYNRDVLYQHK